MDQTYTLSDMMRITGVSKRTLHYYDNIGLLPAPKAANGYRYYCQSDLLSLQRILLLKALDFSIGEIKPLLPLTDQELRPVLAKHREHMAQKIAALQEKDSQLQAFLAGEPLTALTISAKSLSSQYAAEARIRYGSTPAYQTFLDRQASLSSEEKNRQSRELEEGLDAVYQAFSRMTEEPFQTAAAGELVDRWKALLLQVSDFSDGALICIAETYQADPRFQDFFAQYQNPDLTAYISQAVAYHLGGDRA